MIFGLLSMLLTAGPAAAHGQLAESSLPDGATTKTAPESVTLWFTEQPGPSATVGVAAPDGTPVQGEWSVGESKRLREPVQELFLEDGEWVPRFYDTGYAVVVPITHLPEPGKYTLSYSSVASDGEEVQGTVGFTYEGEPTQPPPGVELATSPVSGPEPGTVVPPPVPAEPVDEAAAEADATAEPAPAVEPAAAAEPAPGDDGPPVTAIVIGLALVLAGYAALRLLVRRASPPRSRSRVLTARKPGRIPAARTRPASGQRHRRF